MVDDLVDYPEIQSSTETVVSLKLWAKIRFWIKWNRYNMK